ncbi:GntR family transcriptional regulator [Usitatibacter palustris]|uniref:GntR family transcriptional regulator n=1 Tax=Usitatibacter palustris TaxID=2732487 RepID=UPI00148771A1|nr:GntR family transcriptional regulator [Usitatibacter palustris]
MRSLVADRPLAEQVRAQLAEGMAKGAWKPGEAIPSESQLAARFGVAIGTIRKAVDGLVAQQALVRRQGKGTFVTAHDSGRLMFHFFHIVERDGTKSYPEVRTIDFRRDRAGAEAARALDLSPLDKVVRIRNVLSLRGRRAILDDITLPAQLFPGLTEKIFVARENTIYHLYQSRYGINVLRADERLRGAVASREQAERLGIDEGAALLEIRRVAYTFRDRPVELRVSHVDAARFEYHNTLGKGEVL